MENTKIILDNGVETNVNGLFYIYNSKYYFIYTKGELDEKGYVKLYVVQVCKEMKNTETGTVDTGNMLGLKISNSEEWKKVQESITKIVEDKKNGSKNPEIQYLSITMLVNLKVISKNSFKLMKNIVDDNFGLKLSTAEVNVVNETSDNNTINSEALNSEVVNNDVAQIQQIVEPVQPVQPISEITPVQTVKSVGNVDYNQPIPLSSIEKLVQSEEVPDVGSNNDNVVNNNMDTSSQLEADNSSITGDVIIDYRTKFFEEQQKNQALEAEIKVLNEKLENIKNILG